MSVKYPFTRHPLYSFIWMLSVCQVSLSLFVFFTKVKSNKNLQCATAKISFFLLRKENFYNKEKIMTIIVLLNVTARFSKVWQVLLFKLVEKKVYVLLLVREQWNRKWWRKTLSSKMCSTIMIIIRNENFISLINVIVIEKSSRSIFCCLIFHIPLT